jgi:sec-independent protein translocase protein TatC
MGVVMTEWRAEVYFGVVVRFMLAMGLGFELPVVLLALVKIGILDYQKLSSMRRYMLIINLVIAAILTTPDVVTQVLMAVPLQFLYECAVWIAWYWERRDRKREALEAASGSG